jgi:hypothetical protein
MSESHLNPSDLSKDNLEELSDGSPLCSFIGQRVLITGGADGIGAVSAALFLKRGAEVYVADIKPPDPSANMPGLHYIQCVCWSIMLLFSQRHLAIRYH